MRQLFFQFAVVGLIASACSDGGGDPGGPTPLDPDVLPIAGAQLPVPPETTWQWQLGETLNTDYDVDLYDVDLFETSSDQIAYLRLQKGAMVICYFSAGSSEDWRPDFDRFETDEMGKKLDGWPGERWLDIRSANVHAIMLDRLDLAVSKGCDGVEPDNVDGYTNASGFPLSYRDQLAFNRHLANEAHKRDLSIALKNSGDQAHDLVAYFDFELNEQCHEYDECDQLAPFTQAGKAIFNAEYTDDDDLAAAQELAGEICPAAQAANIRTLILPLDLDDSFRVSCDEQ